VDLLRETFSFSPLVQRAVMFLALAQWELGQEEEAVGLLGDSYENALRPGLEQELQDPH
jgi:hypothetical protein